MTPTGLSRGPPAGIMVYGCTLTRKDGVRMNRQDWIKVGKGALVAAAGAALAYMSTDVIPGLEQSSGTGEFLAAALAVLINAARKWIVSATGGGGGK